MTGWTLAVVLLMVFGVGMCFGFLIAALMGANGRDEYNTKNNEEKPEKHRSNCP